MTILNESNLSTSKHTAGTFTNIKWIWIEFDLAHLSEFD